MGGELMPSPSHFISYLMTPECLMVLFQLALKFWLISFIDFLCCLHPQGLGDHQGFMGPMGFQKLVDLFLWEVGGQWLKRTLEAVSNA